MSVIGRQQEQNCISGALQTVQNGRGSLQLLCGEAGIGKSTLARWAADQAQDKGFPVHWGICWEAGGAPAYWPWTQLLRSLLAAERASPLQQYVEASPALLQLLPEVLPAGVPAQPLQADQARFQLLEGVRSLLLQAARGDPLLLILEDLHAADPDTLVMLKYLAPHLGSLPVCVLGTFRDADARLAGSAAPLWQAARGASLMHLEGLKEGDIDELLQQMTGTGGTATQLQALSERTDGNPFFLTELIQLRAGGYEGEPPDSVNEAILHQVGRLSAETRDLLETAAVMGRTFSEDDLLALSDKGAIDVRSILEPARRLDMIQAVDEQRYRFSHILYRDVLHHTLSPQRQRNLHMRCGSYLKQLIDGGHQHRWQELALQLERAGPGERTACVEAWRKAGQYARQLSAFEEAVYCQQQALSQFGDGPSADTAERCALLLEVADSMLLRGEVEAGHEYCREVFRLARTLANPQLMARAALTFGGSYVAASIDDELISMLEEALSVQPKDATTDRAQVIARLAAALQPAEDPGVPMDMAREAIGLARQCSEPGVLLPTLCSAISALMDIAPARERQALNREYIALARREGNLVEEFRGHTRLVVDCGVLGSGVEQDAAIAACDDIAERLGLPHYQWRAASASAMRSTIHGDHMLAVQQLARATELARQCEDPSAPLCLALQRFALLGIVPQVDSSEAGDVIQGVEHLLQQSPVAATYVRPQLVNARHRFQLPVSPAGDIGPDDVEKIRRDGDTYTLSSVLELAIYRGDQALCEVLYNDLLPHADQCSHLGLMGMQWGGPVALELARCDHFLGRLDRVAAHLDRAQALAETMSAAPALEQIQAMRSGVPDLAAKERAASDKPGLQLVRDGETWRVSFGAQNVTLKDSKGLQILSRLLAEPDREIHVLELVGPVAEERPAESTNEPALDNQARGAYKQRLRELEEELEEAVELGDLGRSEQAREEMEFISRELARAFGLGGRARKSGTDGERARVNVQRRLKDAVKRIGEQIPEAGRYLQGTLDTGTYCRYRPL